jgi:hypothetical protein
MHHPIAAYHIAEIYMYNAAVFLRCSGVIASVYLLLCELCRSASIAMPSLHSGRPFRTDASCALNAVESTADWGYISAL